MFTAKLYFLQVVETGSFRLAAEQLGVEPSSVSRKISALEQHLAVKLFNRSRIRTTPTDIGWQYYERLQILMDEQLALDESIGMQNKALSGTLRITAPMDFGVHFVLDVCQDLQLQYPDLAIEMLLGNQFFDLREHQIDVAIRIGQLPDSSLMAKKIADLNRVFVTSPDYLKQKGEPLTPSDLIHQKHQMIFYSAQQQNGETRFINGDRLSNRQLYSKFTVNNITAIRHLLLSGKGIHLGPTWFFAEDIQQGRLKVILSQYSLNPFPVHCVYLNRHYLPTKTRIFIEKMTEHIQRFHHL